MIDRILLDCDAVKIKIGQLVSSGHIRTPAIVVQQKTRRLVQFELKDDTIIHVSIWKSTIDIAAS
jgi:hypothetical protein